MKYNSKTKGSHLKGLVISGLLLASLGSFAQAQRPVLADAKLGKISVSDMTGDLLDAENIPQEQMLKLSLPVSSENHGKDLPAGSCKIKISFGSKLELATGFDFNAIAPGGYFKWSSATSGGQLQVTGELVKPLPADVHSLDVAVKVKAIKEGTSTITANFLITNHNTTAVLSDENAENNSSYLSYRVAKKLDIISTIPDGNLRMSVYPNPAKNVDAVTIKLVQGRMTGKYSISLYEISGKLVQTKEMEMTFVSNINYKFGQIAPGKYLIKVVSADAKQSTILKFVKL